MAITIQDATEHLCPVGDEYSMVSDAQFELEQNTAGDNPFVQREITKEIFVNWLFKAKTVTTTTSSTYGSTETSTGTMRNFYSSETAEDAPFPMMIEHDIQYGLDSEQIANGLDTIYRAGGEDYTDPLNVRWVISTRPTRQYTGSASFGIFFYIHRNKFYAVWDSQNNLNGLASYSFNITEDSINTSLTIAGSFGGTNTMSVSIDEFFP